MNSQQYDEKWLEGYSVAVAAGPLSACPYKEGTGDYDAWHNGYTHGNSVLANIFNELAIVVSI